MFEMTGLPGGSDEVDTEFVDTEMGDERDDLEGEGGDMESGRGSDDEEEQDDQEEEEEEEEESCEDDDDDDDDEKKGKKKSKKKGKKKGKKKKSGKKRGAKRRGPEHTSCKGTPKKALEPEERTTLQMAKSVAITMVNPRFKNFNRPFLLAILVGVTTIAIFGVMFQYMKSQCSEQTFTGTPRQLAKLWTSGIPTCIDSVSKSRIVDKYWSVKEADGEEHNNVKPVLDSHPCWFPPAIPDMSDDLGLSAKKIREDYKDQYSDESKDMMNPTFSDEACDVLKAKGIDICWNGEIVPNFKRRKELIPLRDPSVYCEGGETSRRFTEKDAGYTTGKNFGQSWLEAIRAKNWEWFVATDAQACLDDPWVCSPPIWADQCDIKTILVALKAEDFPVLHRGGTQTGETDNPFQGLLFFDVPYSGWPSFQSWVKAPEAHLFNNIKEFVESGKAQPIVKADETTLFAVYKVCPETVTTLGAAFGWAAIIELAVTMLFVSILWISRVITTVDTPFAAVMQSMVTDTVFNRREKAPRKKVVEGATSTNL